MSSKEEQAMGSNSALDITAKTAREPQGVIAEFHGQQEGERVLYSFAPHPIGAWFKLIKPTIYSIGMVGAGYFIHKFLGARSETVSNSLYVSGIIYWVISMWWRLKSQKFARTFITDRRIVRFEIAFPGMTRKRALFWTNGFKCKAVPAILPLRLLKLGTLKITPNLGSDEDISCDYVSYCDDLANYIDKILFCVKHNPQEMQSLRPFVKKPKGHRY
jgi:hypothetical protein